MAAPQQNAKLLFGQLRLEPAHPAVYLGLRGALSIWIPIAIGLLSHQLLFGVLSAFAAFTVIAVDSGGSYRTKALSLLSATLANAAAIFFATLINPNPELRVLATFLWVCGAGFAGIYGNTAAIVAFNSAVIFVTSVELPTPPDALQRVILQLLGGVWAMILSLGLWPLRSYRPIFDAVKDSYNGLARLFDCVNGPSSEIGRAYDSLLTQIDNTRVLWTTLRASRAGQSQRGIQMILLLEDASLIANKILSLSQTLELINGDPGFLKIKPEIDHAIHQLRNAVHLLGLIIQQRGESIHLGSLFQALGSLSNELRLKREQIGENSENIKRLLHQVESLIDKIRYDARIAAGLESGLKLAKVTPLVPKESLPLWATIKENLNFNSVVLRHALRLAVVAALAVTFNLLQHLPRGYWSVLTALVVLKPNFGGTLNTAVQRITGTVLGAFIAISLGFVIRDQNILLFCAGLCAFFAFTFRPYNYSLFVIGLTPMVILILNISDVGDWRVGLLRVMETLIGGSLALIGGFALFPMWERRQLRQQLSTTLQANLDYFNKILNTALKRSPTTDTSTSETVENLRNRAALENSNITATAQRALVEPSRGLKDIGPAMVITYYIRSFFTTTVSLMDNLVEFENPRLAFVLDGLGEIVIYVLRNLTQVMERKEALKPLPNLEDSLFLYRFTEHLDHTAETERPLSYLALERMIEEIKTMHAAAKRMTDNPST
jgi:uncharacterized membrane protein YccC